MRIASLVLVFLCSPAWAQLVITVKKASSTVTSTTTSVMTETTQVLAADGSEVGGAIVVERSPVINSTTAAKPVGVIVLDVSPRTFDGLLVRLKSKTAKAILVEPGVYQVSEPGKHEFSVMVFGSNPLALDEDDIVVEVGGTPGPGPKPPGPKPPQPDNGDFEVLAANVNVLARQLGQTQRNQIAAIFATCADKMQSFEFKQPKQATDYISRNWPPCESPACGALFKFISDDAKVRLLSWQEFQFYYRALSDGVLR